MTKDNTSRENAPNQRLSKKFLLLELLLKPLLTIGTKQMITQILDKASNIAQAQTNIAKRNVFKLCIALLVASLGGIIFLMSITAIAAAVFISLSLVLPTSAACAITGIILLIIASALSLSAKSIYMGGCCHNQNDNL